MGCPWEGYLMGYVSNTHTPTIRGIGASQTRGDGYSPTNDRPGIGAQARATDKGHAIANGPAAKRATDTRPVRERV